MRRSTSNLSPKVPEKVPREIIITTNNMNNNEDADTTNQLEEDGTNPTMDPKDKIPKQDTNTSKPSYFIKSQAKMYKWKPTLQHATVGVINEDGITEQYIVSFYKPETMKLTFGASPILDSNYHVVIGIKMEEAYLKQIAFSITKHNVAGDTTLEVDIAIIGEQQCITHLSKG